MTANILKILQENKSTFILNLCHSQSSHSDRSMQPDILVSDILRHQLIKSSVYSRMWTLLRWINSHFARWRDGQLSSRRKITSGKTVLPAVTVSRFPRATWLPRTKGVEVVVPTRMLREPLCTRVFMYLPLSAN